MRGFTARFLRNFRKPSLSLARASSSLRESHTDRLREESPFQSPRLLYLHPLKILFDEDRKEKTWEIPKEIIIRTPRAVFTKYFTIFQLFPEYFVN